MEQWFAIFFYANFLIAFISYMYLFKRRKLIGFHLGMNIAMIAGGGLSLGTGVALINQFPLHYMEITVASAVTGILTGVLFGGLFDYQTLLTGYINGLLMGLMAPMVGAASSGSVPFMLFLEIFIIGSFGMVLVASKLS
ncbi:hypothetical protein [Bacillus sp. V5-8f]|uniref:hypothetical protein n=1 Tax=Bacillus sp. V5-8f TaxID=2053044 RepID=UPI000C780EEF|nr:hypothetical protein [Bacillus sp. V5-8f]PLT33394.1 hypothetical protein CUU64_13950 [Bacillus sp. V5-8f]